VRWNPRVVYTLTVVACLGFGFVAGYLQAKMDGKMLVFCE
jgi:hypothetical protein